MQLYQLWLRVIFLLAKAFVLTKSKKTVGYHCLVDENCSTKHCVPTCEGSEKICIVGAWFFDRHAIPRPLCIEESAMNKYRRYAKIRSRSVGETCHDSQNCVSGLCKRECGSLRWKCIEPKNFYSRNQLQIPECIRKEKIDSLANAERFSSKEQLEFGDYCSSNEECASRNCVHLCEDNSKSQCIEQEISFRINGLKIPECIDKDTSEQLYLLSHDGSLYSLKNEARALKKSTIMGLNSLLRHQESQLLDMKDRSTDQASADEAEQENNEKNVREEMIHNARPKLDQFHLLKSVHENPVDKRKHITIEDIPATLFELPISADTRQYPDLNNINIEDIPHNMYDFPQEQTNLHFNEVRVSRENYYAREDVEKTNDSRDEDEEDIDEERLNKIQKELMTMKKFFRGTLS